MWRMLCLTLAASALSACAPTPQAQRPNILFILADDLGYGDLSCYGQTHFSTPALDQLAREGIQFSACYAGATVCAPSRGALITGLHAGRGRVRGNYESGPNGFGAGLELRQEDTTLAETLKSAGCTTALIGKWGLWRRRNQRRAPQKGLRLFFWVS